MMKCQITSCHQAHLLGNSAVSIFWAISHTIINHILQICYVVTDLSDNQGSSELHVWVMPFNTDSILWSRQTCGLAYAPCTLRHPCFGIEVSKKQFHSTGNQSNSLASPVLAACFSVESIQDGACKGCCQTTGKGVLPNDFRWSMQGVLPKTGKGCCQTTELCCRKEMCCQKTTKLLPEVLPKCSGPSRQTRSKMPLWIIRKLWFYLHETPLCCYRTDCGHRLWAPTVADFSFWQHPRFILATHPFYFGNTPVLFWQHNRFILATHPF